MSEKEEHEEEERTYPVNQSAAFAGGTLVTMGLVDVLAHLGPTGLLVGGLASYVAWKHGPELYEYVREKFLSQTPSEEPDPAEHQRPPRRKRSIMDRCLNRFPEEEAAEQDEHGLEEHHFPHKETREEDPFELDGNDDDDDLLRPSLSSDRFLFSSLLDRFHPTLDQIFLARTATGLDLFCTARDLCHVALAGNTGGGKSSIMRMLMLQLCRVGVRVLLLNPHYTRYDLDTDEDWTPFEPYLVHPPMDCRSYEVIAHYLKSTAKDLIPKRLERRAHSQPVGKPYFLVIDELPSIVREIDAAPDYLRIILEEGRKVGVFLISAAHDFLVKTISPKAGGGSIRECYRTAYYVGGDPITARTLLDMPASLIPEDQLGKGVAMLRGVPAKKAAQVLVPYVENASVYRLLGPSTYTASARGNLPEQKLSQPGVSPVSVPGNDGNGSGNSVETASQAGQATIIDGVFPVSGGNTQASFPSSEQDTPLVSRQTQETIRRMKEARFSDRDIAQLIGLSGRKYKVYQQVLQQLGYTKRAEG